MTLDTSYVERSSDYSLWGLLINAGYLTMTERRNANSATVKIPNGEVMAEFRTLVSELSGINNPEYILTGRQKAIQQEPDGQWIPTVL